VDEADRVHPCNGVAKLGPDPAERGFGKGGPGSVSVDQREEVAACDVREDQGVVRWRGRVVMFGFGAREMGREVERMMGTYAAFPEETTFEACARGLFDRAIICPSDLHQGCDRHTYPWVVPE